MKNTPHPHARETKKPAPKPQDDRTTVVLQVYFEHEGGQPTGFDFRGSSTAPPAHEDPWTRQSVVGKEWTMLDLGWLRDKTGAVVLENLAGTNRATHPTPEERTATNKQVLEVSFGAGVPACIIRPGRVMLFEPVDGKTIRVRSSAEDIKIRLVALPGPGK